MSGVHVNSGSPGTKCQDRVRSARDVLRGMPVKIKRAEVGRESLQTIMHV